MKLLSFALLGSASGASVSLPTQYSAKILLEMPYIGLTEPIDVAYDESAGLQILSYWNGMDKYIYNTDGTSYQIIPTAMDGVNGVETCWKFGKSDLTPMFPDFSTFTADAETANINGHTCNSFTLVQKEYNNTSGNIGTYTFYQDAETGYPVRYGFVGHNAITGGHLDQYHFDYLEFVPGEPDSSVFEPTEGLTCVDIPDFDDDDGGGPTLNNRHTPLDDLKMMHPEGHAHRSDAAEDYFKEHEKEYENELERSERYHLFHHARRYINSMNRKGLTYTLGLNHFADWTNEEKMSARGRKRTTAKDIEQLPEKSQALYTHEVSSTNDVPDTVDWRGTGAVTPIKDQGTCGSCWSYGTTGTIEGQVFLRHGVTRELSQQNLMDCSWEFGNNACDGGLDYDAYAWIIEHGGIATADTYGGYRNADGFCHFTDADVEIGATLTGYVNVTMGDVDALNDALANVGPVSVSIDATPDDFYYYTGGYYNNADCKNGVDDLDHTVLAVGYVNDSDGNKYFIIKNSWSTHWGDEGFAYVAEKGNICGVATTPTYALLE